MVCGLLPANSCEEFMYPAYCYYLASVASHSCTFLSLFSKIEKQEEKRKANSQKLKVPPQAGLGAGLFSDTEFFNQLAITCKVMFLKIVKQTLTFTNQCHQATVS